MFTLAGVAVAVSVIDINVTEVKAVVTAVVAVRVTRAAVIVTAIVVDG